MTRASRPIDRLEPEDTDGRYHQRIVAPAAPPYEHSQPVARYVPRTQSEAPPPMPGPRDTKSFDILEWLAKEVKAQGEEQKSLGTELVIQRADAVAFRREVDAKLDALEKGVTHTFELSKRDSHITNLEATLTVTERQAAKGEKQIEKRDDASDAETKKWKWLAITAAIGAFAFLAQQLFQLLGHR